MKCATIMGSDSASGPAALACASTDRSGLVSSSPDERDLIDSWRFATSESRLIMNSLRSPSSVCPQSRVGCASSMGL